MTLITGFVVQGHIPFLCLTCLLLMRHVFLHEFPWKSLVVYDDKFFILKVVKCIIPSVLNYFQI